MGCQAEISGNATLADVRICYFLTADTSFALLNFLYCTPSKKFSEFERRQTGDIARDWKSKSAKTYVCLQSHCHCHTNFMRWEFVEMTFRIDVVTTLAVAWSEVYFIAP